MVHGMVHMVQITNTGGFSIHNISIATFSPFSAGLLVVGKNMSKLFSYDASKLQKPGGKNTEQCTHCAVVHTQQQRNHECQAR